MLSIVAVDLQPTLYDGTSGIALFLAALAWLTGETTYRDGALAALKPLTEYVRKSASFPVEERFGEMGIGGATGLGSCLYALVHRLGRRLFALGEAQSADLA